MAIELHLQKTSKEPWGFRLAGGVEYDVPLTVIKVTESSIAENAGMNVGDVVVRLNDIPMTGLTHSEAHDTLLSAGNDFVLAVRRGDLSHLPPRLLLYETSIENAEDNPDPALNKSNGNENDKDLNITDEEIVNIIGEQVHISSKQTVENTNLEITETISTMQKQSEVSKVILSEESQTAQEKKWSTFLQKPKNPKPKAKMKEPEGPKAPPYRVIIKKQPKKSENSIGQHITNEEETAKDDNATTNEGNNTDNLEEAPMEERSLETDINQCEDMCEGEVNSTEGDDENNNINEADTEIDEKPEPYDAEENLVSRRTSVLENRLSINLEEQLAQVQQQLLALSQLPSAIQQTLNAVTQQLSEIVTAKHTQEQEITIEAKVTTEEEITEEYLDVTEEREEKALSVLEEESYELYEEEAEQEENKEGPVEAAQNESEDEQALFEELEKQIEEEEQKKVEEMEALRIQQENLQKKDKERRPSIPLTPLERPIILPGGRKWTNPEDAVSKIRRPSVTDEKIANTINTFSEVIVGRTMGINFLKFQPPPKNLDYLQRSAVYRLVHEKEPPPKGIDAREVKFLAEQDYYVEE